MRPVAHLAVVLLIGCSVGTEVAPDASVGELGELCDAYGETCENAPDAPTGEPVATLCHDSKGWCVRGVCRPQCNSATRHCSALVIRSAPPGIGYCEPR